MVIYSSHYQHPYRPLHVGSLLHCRRCRTFAHSSFCSFSAAILTSSHGVEEQDLVSAHSYLDGLRDRVLRFPFTCADTVRVFPAGNIGTTPLATLVTGTTAQTLTWTVNLAAGTGVTLAVTDSSGSTIPSAQTVIQAGSSTSCVGGDASTAASTGFAGATSAQSTSATSVATTLS